MKKTLITLSLLVTFAIMAEDDTWYSFRGGEKELIGFKNADGEVMIKPKFGVFTNVRKFKNIISVSEYLGQDKSIKFYFLTKSGKVIKKHPHVFDMTMDCENEGYIRFTDKKSGLTGLLNSVGEVVIPAQYSDLSKVQNGVLAGLKNGVRACLSGKNTENCEHWIWAGGADYLLTPNNDILVDGLEEPPIALDFYSMHVQDKKDSAPNAINMKGVNGKYYVFNPPKTEFKQWLKNYLTTVTVDKLEKISFPTITFQYPVLRGTMPKQNFLSLNGGVVAKKLREIAMGKREFAIIDGDFPFDDKNYDRYRDTCGDDSKRYPTFDIITTHENLLSERSQDYFSFIKTDDGYRLFSVTLRTAPLFSGDTVLDTLGMIHFIRNNKEIK